MQLRGSVSLVFASVAIIYVYAAPAKKECVNITEPNEILNNFENGTWDIMLLYPMDNITVSYVCPTDDDPGAVIFAAEAIVYEPEFNSDRKFYSYAPVPGINLELDIIQSLDGLKVKTYIDLDDDGFMIKSLCYSEEGIESKKWTNETKVPQDFPFQLTDAGNLQFNLDKCNLTEVK